MESTKLSPTQESMENMSHFMEECDDIIMSHQRRSIWGRFRKVRNHSSERIAALATGEVVTRQEWPYCCMRVFGSYMTRSV